MSFIKNTAEENFGTAGGAVTIDGYEAIFANGAANQISTGVIALNNARTYANGDPMIFPIGALSIELPMGAFPNTFAKGFTDDFLAARGASATQVKLYNGTTEISVAGYTAQTVEMASSLT